MEIRPHSIKQRREYERFRYQRDKDRIRSVKHAWKKRNTEKVRAQLAKRNGTPKKIWDVARRRALRKGIPFTITVADIVVPENCPIFGMKLQCGKGSIAPSSPTLDRINPALGYVPGNIAVISHKANAIKQDATHEEIAKVAAWVRYQYETANLEPLGY